MITESPALTGMNSMNDAETYGCAGSDSSFLRHLSSRHVEDGWMLQGLACRQYCLVRPDESRD